MGGGPNSPLSSDPNSVVSTCKYTPARMRVNRTVESTRNDGDQYRTRPSTGVGGYWAYYYE
eukprot:3942003-Rhodomonas_salina.2